MAEEKGEIGESNNGTRADDKDEGTEADESSPNLPLEDRRGRLLRKEAVVLMDLLHKYARENLLLANIYIKDPAVTLIKRDQKVSVVYSRQTR